MKLHTVIDDNFFDKPDEMVKYANTIEYYETDSQNWPGGRSLNMWELNEDLFNFITNKVLSYYFDLNIMKVSWTHSNIRFHKINPGDWHRHNKKHTRIHKDDTHIAGIIYLNKDVNKEETGTSFYNNDKNKIYGLNNCYNNAVFFQGNRVYHGATGIDNEEERLTIVFFMDGIQYKYRQ